MGISEYRRRRDFAATPEPRGHRARRPHRPLSFVIQKHDASHLHYDFRLELDGVLKSWAVPKGPDVDPANKRLAMQVEDHPLEYGGFEGVIPNGQYGGGTVLLWDNGVWEPLGDPATGLRAGRLEFILRGKKLQGGWMLVRKGGQKGDAGERHWFLFNEADDFARRGASITEELPLSVATGRNLEQIAAGSDRVWGPRAEAPSKRRPRRAPDELAGVRLTHPDNVLYPDQGLITSPWPTCRRACGSSRKTRGPTQLGLLPERWTGPRAGDRLDLGPARANLIRPGPCPLL
jgi:bifunctional non-homologous end joining protein LigD